MGSNGGSGEPMWFRCAACRKRRNGKGFASEVKLTGRVKLREGAKCRIGQRHDQFAYEYICGVCGHSGWSRHMDLRKKWWTWRTLGGEP